MFKFSSFMGAKRVKINSKFQLKKHSGKRRRHNDEEDRISQLPDDVLVYILTFLSSVKEAGRTSVLSSRWINLWKHFPRLNFNADMVLDKIRRQVHLVDKERDKYVKWVDYIIQSYKAPTLKELIICFDLDESIKDSIDRWLEFAFSRRVERLELDLSYNLENCYYFPDELLTTPISSETVLDYFNSLKELCFKGVDVSGEAIDFFLRNCLLLEKLVVQGSYEISDHVEVCGSSLVLKHLEVVHCPELKSIKISAPNLISLKVSILDQLLLENVPMLVDVHVTIEGGLTNTLYIERLLGSLSCCISQLEILSLLVMDDEGMEGLCQFPDLPKLKKLVIEYWGEGNQSLIGPTALIRASPYLEEFHLRLALYVDKHEGPLPRGSNGGGVKVVNAAATRHEHLKMFKFYGYYGHPSDVELVKYILDNCVVLENIIIDPFNVIRGQRSLTQRARLTKSERIARDHARQLLQTCKTPPPLSQRQVELVIL